MRHPPPDHELPVRYPAFRVQKPASEKEKKTKKPPEIN